MVSSSDPKIWMGFRAEEQEQTQHEGSHNLLMQLQLAGWSVYFAQVSAAQVYISI